MLERPFKDEFSLLMCNMCIKGTLACSGDELKFLSLVFQAQTCLAKAGGQPLHAAHCGSGVCAACMCVTV